MTNNNQEDTILDYINGNDNAENKYTAKSSIPNEDNNASKGINIKKIIIILVSLIVIVATSIFAFLSIKQSITNTEESGIVTGISLKGVSLNLNKTNLSEITPQYPVYENITDFMNARASRGLVKDNSGLNAEITQSYYLYDNNETQIDIKNEQEKINGNQYNHYHDLAEPFLDANGQYVPKEVEVEGILYFDANGTLKQITIDYQNRHKSYLALQSDTNKVRTTVQQQRANSLVSSMVEPSTEEKQAQYHDMKVNEIASTVESNTNEAECFAIEGELVVVKPKDLTNYIIEPDNFYHIKAQYYDIYGKTYA